jgi:hypothetical protein
MPLSRSCMRNGSTSASPKYWRSVPPSPGNSASNSICRPHPSFTSWTG